MEWLHGKSRKIAELNKRVAKYEEFNGLLGVIGKIDCPGWAETDLRKEISNRWPNRHKPRYTRVKVLLVRWPSDDLGVSREIDRLGPIFTDYYRYEVSKYCIPDFQPSSALSKRVWQFIGDDAPDTLLIFYYGKHGQRDPLRNEILGSAS
jgi:hypothetical protein